MKKKKFKISFCTVCMNRLHHLKETLPKNIKDNINYENVEFVILNYNSKDGLDEWIADNMSQHIESGILVYIKTDEPKYFLRSHSKNIASKKASGDIICNVDADNYIGKGFASFINKQFLNNYNCYITVTPHLAMRDCLGRVCLSKDDFYATTGYDESMVDYGYEDLDLLNRLHMLGRKKVYISQKKFLKVVEHDHLERIENESHFMEKQSIYIRYINHYSSELIYLFKQGDFKKGIILLNPLINSDSFDNLLRNKDMYKNSLLDSKWENGCWTNDKFNLTLVSKDNEMKLSQKEKGKLYHNNDKKLEYHECTEQDVVQDLLMFLSEINNRIKMIKNKNEKLIRVNERFGEINLIENVI